MDDETLEDRTIARLERRVLALEKALRPFAVLAREIDAAPTGPDAPDLMGVRVPLASCRRAHQLLKDIL